MAEKIHVSPGSPPKIQREFSRDFSFEDHHCSINEERSTNLFVDSGFSFAGAIGAPQFSSKDNFGSQFVSFNLHPNNKQCGVFTVRLVGCGHNWLKTCKGHARIKGSVKLSGVSIRVGAYPKHVDAVDCTGFLGVINMYPKIAMI